MDTTPAGMVTALNELHSKLDSKVTPFHLPIQAKILRTMADGYLAQLEYERMRRYEGIDPIDFFETGRPLLREEDARLIREAQSLLQKLEDRFKEKPTAPDRTIL